MTTAEPYACAAAAVTPGLYPSIGGKAANLHRLGRAGQAVPPWYVVTAAAYKYALAASGLAARIAEASADLTGGDDAAAVATRIQQWIIETPLPDDLREAIAARHREQMQTDAHVAVRSSALAEDSAEQSFAGMHDSFLYIRGEEETLDAVRRVWASAYNERALAYRRKHGIPLDDIVVAVLVQEMIAAKVSGVMFTVNPVSGDVGELVISSLYGLGEGLVSAGLPADTFTVEKEGLEIAAEVAEKDEQIVHDDASGQGVHTTPVDDDARPRPSLNDAQVRDIARLGLAVENYYGRPQDIEFSVDGDGKPWLLQSRPVTTVSEYGPAAGNHLIWDNSNIIESYSGVTSPMTFSFIRRAYTIVYHCFAEVMGITPKIVRANEPVFSNMLGLVRGQVYYNLLNWYRLIRLFPGFNYNKTFMESMMGVKEPAELKGETAPPSALQKYFVELPRLGRLLVRSTWNFSRIRTLAARFESNFRVRYDRWAAMDFNACKPHELMAVYRDMETALLWRWQPPIINDFFVMIFYGVLKKLCGSWCGDTTGSLQNDLICGEGGIESTEPTRMLLGLAASAQKNERLRQMIREQPADELAKAIPADPDFAEFSADVSRYLDLYGFRCMNELKLEEPSLRDRPDFLYTVIRNYLAVDRPEILDVGAIDEREQGIRSKAEATAGAALSGLSVPWLRRPVFRWALANARLGVKNRENMRFARTRIYGLLRDLIRAMGRQFAAEGILHEGDDVFYLTLDECWDFIKGTAVTTDLAALAEIRRREFDGYRATDPADDRFDSYGMVYHRNGFRARQEVVEPSADGVLRGIGCCPGQVRGPVKALRTPDDDLRLAGEILVAERTDPGWVPLYPSVSGILIERGSILSHSAIVAREMGIPTIVGIPGLFAALQTGQHVAMDGAAGTVEVIETQDVEG